MQKFEAGQLVLLDARHWPKTTREYGLLWMVKGCDKTGGADRVLCVSVATGKEYAFLLHHLAS